MCGTRGFDHKAARLKRQIETRHRDHKVQHERAHNHEAPQLVQVIIGVGVPVASGAWRRWCAHERHGRARTHQSRCVWRGGAASVALRAANVPRASKRVAQTVGPARRQQIC